LRESNVGVGGNSPLSVLLVLLSSLMFSDLGFNNVVVLGGDERSGVANNVAANGNCMRCESVFFIDDGGLSRMCAIKKSSVIENSRKRSVRSSRKKPTTAMTTKKNEQNSNLAGKKIQGDIVHSVPG
jgi:hypothetical protein